MGPASAGPMTPVPTATGETEVVAGALPLCHPPTDQTVVVAVVGVVGVVGATD